MSHGTARSATHLNLTPPKDWYDLERLWAENFAILRTAIVAHGIVEDTQAVGPSDASEVEIYTFDFAPGELHVGDNITNTLSGVYSNATGADDFTLSFYMNAVLLHTLTRPGVAVQTDTGWNSTFDFTVRGDGTLGSLIDFESLIDGEAIVASGDSTIHTIDTTILQQLRVTAQWGASKAGNVLYRTQGHTQYANI